MPSLAEIDLALRNARDIPALDRGPAWFAYVDSLLEQRAKASERGYEMAVLSVPETR